jgi:ligand-binding sensor domain-containing protein
MRRLILITIFILTNFCLFGQVWRKYEINALNHIAVDNQGNKWFSTYDGVYMFDNSDWTKFDITNGLATNEITSILIDNLGNKWFGSFSTENTDSTFVTKFDGINWKKYNVSDSSSNYDHCAIWDIKQDSLGNIWFATTSGVSMFNGMSWNYYHKNDGLPSDYIRCINFDKYGNIWFGSRNGLTKFTDTTWVTYCTPDTIYGSYANNIYSIAFDNQNILWAGGSLVPYFLF